MLTTIYYGKKGSGKTLRLIENVTDNSLFITNKCSVDYIKNTIKGHLNIDVISSDDIFNFLAEKLQLNIQYNEEENFIKFIEKIDAIDRKSSLSVDEMFDLHNKLDPDLFNDTTSVHVPISDRLILEDLQAIYEKEVMSKIQFERNIIDILKEKDDIAYNNIFIDEMPYYSNELKDLFLLLAEKADKTYLATSYISERHRSYNIYKNAVDFLRKLEDGLSSIQGMLIDKKYITNKEEMSSAKDFALEYFGTKVIAEEKMPGLYTLTHKKEEDEINWLVDNVASLLKNGNSVTIGLSDLEKALYLEPLLAEKGVGVNIEGLVSNKNRAALAKNSLFKNLAQSESINVEIVKQYVAIYKKELQETVRLFFERFGPDVDTALQNGADFDKENANIVVSTIEEINDKKFHLVEFIRREMRDFVSLDFLKEINIDNILDKVSQMEIILNKDQEFIFKDNAVNIVSLKTASTYKPDYVFIPFMTELVNESQSLSRVGIQEINKSFKNQILSGEEWYNIALTDLYSAIINSTKNTYISYAEKDKDGLTQSLVEPLKNLFESFSADKENKSDDEQLFLNLSESLYHYKNYGTFPNKGKDALYLLQENPHNIKRIEKLVNDINKNDNSFNHDIIKNIINKKEPVFSVTRVESYNKCPFKGTIDYVLRPRDNKEYEENSMTAGTYYHNALSEIVMSLWDKKLGFEDFYRQGRVIAERIMNAHNERVAITKRGMEAEKEMMIDRAVYAAYGQINNISKGSFRPVSTEYKVSTTMNINDGKEVNVTGIIDRVDEANIGGVNYARIIDYKTSGKTISYSLLKMGVQLQLPIYSSLLQTRLAGMYYTQIPNHIDENGKIDDKRYQLKGITTNNEDIFIANDKTLKEKGQSDVIQISYNKNGSLSSRSNVKVEDEISEMVAEANAIFRETATKILSGNNDIDPLTQPSLRPCVYCKYKSICQKK